MPFDGLPDTSVTDRIIDRALELLGPNGEDWIQGSASSGTHMCLGQAIYLAAKEIDPVHTRDRIVWAASGVVHGSHPLMTQFVRALGRPIEKFNDAPGRSFAEIKDALNRGREKIPA